MQNGIFSTLKNDIPASILVFLVALPLCLGISLASGAPLLSGLIAGVIGGIIVGALSGSNTGVSGPAAGLSAIVFTSISTLGGYDNLLVAVVLGGLMQIIFGLLRAGNIGNYFPSPVIKGMLSGIGIIIIIKQIPYFFGYDTNPTSGYQLTQVNNSTIIHSLSEIWNNMTLGSSVIGCISFTILMLWDRKLSKKGKVFQIIQGPLVVVTIGIIFYVFTQSGKTLSIPAPHLVNIPILGGINDFFNQLTFPNYKKIIQYDIWITAFTIALVASLETLLCVEATDKLDPDKNVTPKNRELLAQGAGNALSGMIGGLPITQVIIRSSANIQSGAKTKLSTIFHGFLLFASVVAIPQLLNKIPLSVLAAILFNVGYKLTQPILFREMYNLGWRQFASFTATISGVIFIDLPCGIGIGLIVYSLSSFKLFKPCIDNQCK